MKLDVKSEDIKDTTSAIAIPENDVKSEKFESKLDPYFSSKAKDNDAWSRRASIKLFGQWT